MCIWFEKKVVPQRFVYHVSWRKYRSNIQEIGLSPKACDESKWSFTGDNKYPPLIFANNCNDIFSFG